MPSKSKIAAVLALCLSPILMGAVPAPDSAVWSIASQLEARGPITPASDDATSEFPWLEVAEKGNSTSASCAGQCSPTRLECNNNCFCFGCTSATYSCVDTGAGCQATCTCVDCTTPNWCW